MTLNNSSLFSIITIVAFIDLWNNEAVQIVKWVCKGNEFILSHCHSNMICAVFDV